MRTLVASCILLAASLTGWAAYALYSLRMGRADGEIIFGALVAAVVGCSLAAVGVAVSARRQGEWPRGYVAGSLAIGVISVAVGIWAWAGI
jgi:drug/metabolite transporter (DMT)-like permease